MYLSPKILIFLCYKFFLFGLLMGRSLIKSSSAYLHPNSNQSQYNRYNELTAILNPNKSV